ncbi:SH3 domain-containing protein [Sneathiella chungangensis]|uniref:SH3 domain-containing protein n=1 Tax=Sneathiella chungangensis TaxID=1418234 RepID=A0A845M6I0_9PROT|nr:SH3 domain-containing protein [Sneathiella chungangensis]
MSHLLQEVTAKSAAAVKSALYVGVLTAGLGFALSPLVSTASAEPDDPDYFRVNMKPGASLNVRQDPSLKAKKIGSLPAEAQGIVNLGCHVGMPYLEWRNSTTAIRKVETRRKWCNIQYNGMVGWTAGQYLEADRPE